MLLVSESGASRKIKTNGERTSFWTFDLGVKGIVLTIHMASKKFLDASSFEKVQMLHELFYGATPVHSTLKSVDGLGAVDTRKRPDVWGRILTLHTERCVARSLENCDKNRQGSQWLSTAQRDFAKSCLLNPRE
jgi:hypothetical protein